MAIIDELTDEDITNVYQATYILVGAANLADMPGLRPRELLGGKHLKALLKLRRAIRQASHDAEVSQAKMN